MVPTPHTPPIRIGILGLGRGTALLRPGLWASIAHLPYFLASPHYKVTAVSNSTVESAQCSIDFHNLGPEVKAYGSPEDLSKDETVDMVVVSVRIGKHYELAKPALEAGKDVFVEWPLGATLTEAEELATLAKEKGVKTMIGLQSRASALVVKLRELLGSGTEGVEGEIGRVVHSSVVGSFGGIALGNRGRMWPEGAEYYLDMDSGGNSFMIYFGHFLDTFTHVLGPFAPEPQAISAIMKTEWDRINIVNTEGEVVRENYLKTAPDQLLLQGTLASGALASISYRMPSSSALDDVGIRWLITGTKGQVEVVAPESQWQFDPPGIVLRVKIGDEETRAVDWKGEADKVEVESVRERVFPGKNTARAWEAFAAVQMGEDMRERYPDFADGVLVHKLLERVRGAAGW